jgi:Na+-transporting methylmalonyl-CoA/oxaloacetate decarboxylase gamma subunit
MREAIHLMLFGAETGQGSPLGFVGLTLGVAPLVLFAIAFAMLVVSYVIQSFLAPKPEKPKPSALEEWEFPQMEDGTPQTILFGDGWLEGPMVAHYGNYRTKAIKSEGKK